MRSAVGVDLGGTKVQAVTLAGSGEVLGRARARTPGTGDVGAVVDAIAEAAGRAADEAGVALDALAGVGIGAPGRVTRDGTVSGAANLPGFGAPVPLAGLVAEELGVRRVVADNDVNAGALGEQRQGAGRGVEDLLAVFAGSGVGGGVVLGGRVRRGAHGAAGEVGHMVVVRGGDECPCGRRGCLEAYAGRVAMERKARAAAAAGRPTSLPLQDPDRRITSGVIAAALEQGDALTHELVDGAVAALGAGIASAVNLLDLDLVVLGGGLTEKLGGPFADRVRDAALPNLFVRPATLRVVPAALGDLAGAIGAALLALDAA
ncbi:MAG TPA: ROK family protein [Actinomycetes bacterium]|nr:ROK family protein [Actinomycetes bacterium]